MSKSDFSPEEFRDRGERVRTALKARDLQHFLAFHPVSIHWLTGSDAKSYQEFQCLLVSADDPGLWILTREGERCEFETDAWVDRVYSWGGGQIEDPLPILERMAQEREMIGRRIGMEVPAYYLHPHDYLRVKALFGEASLVESNRLIHDLKLVKSAAELRYIRQASRIADLGMETFVQSLRSGRTELQVAGDVYRRLMQEGSGIAASPMNLVSGDRSCYSHGAPTMRRLRQGDFGSIEYGATCCRYTATIGRQFCLGDPTPRMVELTSLVRRAADACIAEIRAGAAAVTPHEAARQVIRDAGLEAGRVHTTGYGLAPGFPPTWGEPLHMIGGSDDRLAAGMVLTVEPPVFLGHERLGARIIDNVLVTENGAELLSTFPRDLIVAEPRG
ncbi:MAG: aminopeptidase P family protein [Planctomycetes bacterium]|nr:aminopeptidase P family protein [Planctomycetota bacterium]